MFDPNTFDWAAAAELEPPAELTLADGTTVPNEVGAEVFNHYDMRLGTITRPARKGSAQPDTSGLLPGGIAWWVDTTAGYLDGSRMCSAATARKRGWL